MFQPIANALARFSVSRPWLAIAAVLVAVGVFGAQGMPSMSNESSEFAPDAPAIAAADRIDQLFGTEASVTPLQVVVSASGGDVLTTAGLEAVTAVTQAIRDTEVDGQYLGERLVTRSGTEPILSFLSPLQTALETGVAAPTTDAEVKSMLQAGLERLPADQAQLFRGLYDDGADPAAGSATAGLMVAFLRAPSTPADERQLTELEGRLASVLEGASWGDVTARPFSTQLIAYAGDQAGIEIPLLLFGAIGIIGLVLLLVYLPGRAMAIWQRLRRTAADTLLTLLVVIFAITTTNGAAVILGPDGLGLIGNVAGPSSIVPILLVGLGVDYVIHLDAAYRKAYASGAPVELSMSRGLRVVGGALVLSVMTTVFGFLTNLFSGTTALITFGVLASLGIAAAFLYATILFPAARVLLDRRAARRDRLPRAAFASSETGLIDRAVGTLAVIPRRAPWLAVGIAAILLVGATAVATNLRSGFSFVDFVPQGSPVRIAAEELSTEFAGGLGETTQVLVDADLTEPETWNATLAASAAAGSVDGVVTIGGQPRLESPQSVVASLIDPASPGYVPTVAELAAASGVDATGRAAPEADLAGFLATVREVAPARLGAVLAPGAAVYRFSTQAGTDGALALAAELQDVFGPNAVATSREIIDATVVEAISSTQVQSLLLALAGAAGLLALNFLVSDRRPMLGLLTMAPVGGVVILLYAFMVLAGIEFGPVTATLAAIVIGVGVDYAIHVTHRFMESRRDGMSVDEAVAHTLGTSGSAVMVSAITTALGFAILTQSSLIPFEQFGLLTLVALAGSALVSVLVLPSMLTLWARATERGTVPVSAADEEQRRTRGSRTSEPEPGV
jgi:predicted RND superfamily exporter protein